MTLGVRIADRYVGCLLGLACGDAVGTTLEFTHRASLTPISDMVGGGPFALKPGQWTDDTSMALCLGESLLTCNGFDARDQMARYLNWWQWGYWSATGECFDIGMTVRQALSTFQENGKQGIPAHWLERLHQRADIEEMALALFRAAQGRATPV